MYFELRKELREFYDKLEYEAFEFNQKCTEVLDEKVTDDMSPYRQKAVQYETIAELCTPVLFEYTNYYYETTTMSGTGWGVGENYRSKTAVFHPGGWLYRRHRHKFVDQDPKRYANSRVPFYSWVGEYGDFRYHFAFQIELVLKEGLKGLYKRAEKAYREARKEEEKEYLECTLEGLLSVKRICEKFAQIAEKMLAKGQKTYGTKRCLQLKRIAQTAARTPWEEPQNTYEALNTILLLHKIIGGLEGVGISTMGRYDVLLLPFYEKDIITEIYTKEEIYELSVSF